VTRPSSLEGGGAGVNPAPTVKVWMGEENEMTNKIPYGLLLRCISFPCTEDYFNF